MTTPIITTTIEDPQESPTEGSGDGLPDGRVMMTPTVVNSVQNRPETVEDAQPNPAIPSPAPADSTSTQISQKPSSRRSDLSVCYTKLLHNDGSDDGSSPQESSGNGAALT